MISGSVCVHHAKKLTAKTSCEDGDPVGSLTIQAFDEVVSACDMIFIYKAEEHPRYMRLAQAINQAWNFQVVEGGKAHG